MAEKFRVVQWVCQHCGGSGATKLPIGLCDQGFVSELVRAHSLASNGCAGDARRCLQTRPDQYSDADWERAKELARNKAAAVRREEPLPIVAGDSAYSVASLREYLSGEPTWEDWVRAARYLR